MAGIQLNMKRQLRASSILEVIIAMVLIVVIFSIAMEISANVQRLLLSAKQIHAQAVLKEALFKAEQVPDIAKQTLTMDGFNVTQEITVYNNSDVLHQITLVAYDANQEKIAELKQVVYDAQ
jgi:Tfp pilus assembly protein PilV